MGQATICTLLRPNSTHKRIFTKSVRMYDYVRIRRTNTIVPTMFSRQDEDREDVLHARGAHTESNNKPAETDARTGTSTKLAEAKAHS